MTLISRPCLILADFLLILATWMTVSQTVKLRSLAMDTPSFGTVLLRNGKTQPLRAGGRRLLIYNPQVPFISCNSFMSRSATEADYGVFDSALLLLNSLHLTLTMLSVSPSPPKRHLYWC